MKQKTEKGIVSGAAYIIGFVIIGVFTSWWVVLGLCFVLWGHSIEMDISDNPITPECYNEMTKERNTNEN